MSINELSESSEELLSEEDIVFDKQNKIDKWFNKKTKLRTVNDLKS
jgi:hypothetical protein